MTAEIAAVYSAAHRIKTQAPSRKIVAAEQALVAACRNGDPGGQRELYEQHHRNVHRLMSRMVGAEYADDLTQQVFLRVLQTISQFRGESAFSTWMYRVATNEALQFLRRNSKQALQELSVELVDYRPSEQNRLDDREMLDHVLANLDPSLLATFLLREVENLSYHEIALALDIAEGTVASRLNRARRLLRDWILASQ